MSKFRESLMEYICFAGAVDQKKKQAIDKSLMKLQVYMRSDCVRGGWGWAGAGHLPKEDELEELEAEELLLPLFFLFELLELLLMELLALLLLALLLLLLALLA